MIRRLGILVAVVATMAITATSVFAANPHTVGSPGVSIQGNSLVVSASVAGLGNLTEVDFSLEGSVDVFSRCYNKGGNKPQADNKQETISVSETKTFPVKNGRTNVSFTISPLTTLQCPGNQRVVIESLTWDLTLYGPQGFSYNFSS